MRQVLLLLCLLTPALALALASGGNSGAGVPGSGEEERDLVGAPLFVSNPAFGTGLGAVGIYLYDVDKADKVSPRSAASLVGLYSDTDSYFTGLFTQAFLKKDTWRATGGLFGGKINNRFDIPRYGNVRFATRLRGVGGKLEHRVKGDVFLGGVLGYHHIWYEEGNAVSGDYFDDFDVEENQSWVVGATLSYDTRDDPRYPLDGVLCNANFTAVPEALGAHEGYNFTELVGNSYDQWRPGHVLALRAYGRFTPPGTPYVGLSTLGRRSDLRGYVSGEKVAENLVSTQAEYRWMFHRRVGAVGFGGVAALYDDGPSHISSDEVYFSAGAGIRLVLHEKSRINLRVDYAWGEDDESGLYVSVGEAF